MRKILTAMVSTVFAAGALLIAPNAAQATPGDGWVGWVNLNSTASVGVPMMMTAWGDNSVSPYPLVIEANSATQQDPSEDWLLTAEGGGWVSMRNAGTPDHRALAVANARTDRNAPVISWTYEKGHPEQQWGQTQLKGDAAGYYHLKNRKSGLCLAEPGGQDVANLIQWTCEAGHAEQEWGRYDG